jgi:pimeloyl-ACP methyl ester carboxylesterase
MRPFFEGIAKVKWIVMDGAAHFSHVDRREAYLAHLAAFVS